jgi:hypothetical protein
MTIKQLLLAQPRQILTMAELLQPSTTYKHKDNYVYVDRGAPITLVAHVDTLPRKKGFALDTSHKNVITTKGGGILGADDRAGCFALFALADCYCNLLFTNYEEIGGIGAQAAAEDLEQHMLDNGVRLMVELDRKGCNEYVTYSYNTPPEIHAYAQSYGYVESQGSYSDIAEFYSIPAINVSCGYYHQHTDHERLHVDELYLSIDRVKRMLINPPGKLYSMDYDGLEDWDDYDERELDTQDWMTNHYTNRY